MSRKALQQQQDLALDQANQTIIQLRANNEKLTKQLSDAVDAGLQWRTKYENHQVVPTVTTTIEFEILVQKATSAKMASFETKLAEERKKKRRRSQISWRRTHLLNS